MITFPGKIPISIRPLFWLVAFFIGWVWTSSLTGAFICMGVILVSVLLHEFGHALTAVCFGQKTRIELAAFGGFTYREGRKLKLWEEFLVVLNGPIAGFALFLVAYALYKHVPIANQYLAFGVKFAFVANLFWTVINLVPILPLDGGHLMSIILEAIFGFRGVKIAIVAGICIGVLLSVFFLAIGMFLVGALFLILTFESFRSLRYYKIFSEQDRDQDLQQLMQQADTSFQAGKSEEALEKLEQVRSRAKQGILYTMATQEMAQICKEKGQYEKGYKLLRPIKKTLSGENLALYHFLAFTNHDYKEVLETGNRCFQDNPSYDTALINALAYGASGKAEPALGWLECALREGLPSIAQALKREEFDSIRHDPNFRLFEQSH